MSYISDMSLLLIIQIIIMGYSTDFSGEFTITPQLKPEHREYLKQFAYTRRMKRNPELAEKLDDPIRKAVGLPIGRQGEYFVGGQGFAGQERDESILDYNSPPSVEGEPEVDISKGFYEYAKQMQEKEKFIEEHQIQPSLWCQWTPNEDGTILMWNGAEKFYAYVEWLKYITQHFLERWGYKLNGEVTWQGEDPEDMGKIVVKDNDVQVLTARIIYE